MEAKQTGRAAAGEPSGGADGEQVNQAQRAAAPQNLHAYTRTR